MLNLSMKIVITDPKDSFTTVFHSAASVEIASSWKNLTDTAKITFPRHMRLKNSVYDDINEVIVRGSKVEVDLGYNGNMTREFTGYITRVDAKTPFSIECEDEMWKLKQTSFTQTWRSVNLKELVSHLYKGRIKVEDVNIGSYRILNKSAAKVFDDLREMDIYSYFRYDETLDDIVLYAGFGGYAFQTNNQPVYNFNKNVIDNSLTYRMAEDITLKVKAFSIQKDNTKVEVEVGDENGDKYPLECPPNLNQQEVKKRALTKLQLLKISGYKGSITGFGIPFVRHGDAVVMEDNMFPERSGAYFADEVKVTFGTGGFRRNVELAYRAS